RGPQPVADVHGLDCAGGRQCSDDAAAGAALKRAVPDPSRREFVGGLALTACSLLFAGRALPAAGPVATGRVYVSDERGGTVVVVDATSGAVLSRIAVGKRP